MNAVFYLSGFNMTEAFARLAFLDSSSMSSPTGSPVPGRYDVVGRDVEQGRPLPRKCPLEQDGDEHAGWSAGNVLHPPLLRNSKRMVRPVPMMRSVGDPENR